MGLSHDELAEALPGVAAEWTVIGSPVVPVRERILRNDGSLRRYTPRRLDCAVMERHRQADHYPQAWGADMNIKAVCCLLGFDVVLIDDSMPAEHGLVSYFACDDRREGDVRSWAQYVVPRLARQAAADWPQPHERLWPLRVIVWTLHRQHYEPAMESDLAAMLATTARATCAREAEARAREAEARAREAEAAAAQQQQAEVQVVGAAAQAEDAPVEEMDAMEDTWQDGNLDPVADLVI